MLEMRADDFARWRIVHLTCHAPVCGLTRGVSQHYVLSCPGLRINAGRISALCVAMPRPINARGSFTNYYFDILFRLIK